MTHDHDFEHVRHTAATSVIAIAGGRVIAAVTAAWATSAAGGWLTTATDAFARAAPAARVRWWAITIGVATIVHVLLRSFMSSTVAPAMPLGVYIVIAAASAVIAWQADAFHRAWHGSRLSRLWHDGN